MSAACLLWPSRLTSADYILEPDRGGVVGRLQRVLAQVTTTPACSLHAVEALSSSVWLLCRRAAQRACQ